MKSIHLVQRSTVLVSKKLLQTMSVKETTPATINSQCAVYLFQCSSCNANCVGFTTRHLYSHQRINEHRHSANGPHLSIKHGQELFKVLKKCTRKFDCLIYETLFIRDIIVRSLSANFSRNRCTVDKSTKLCIMILLRILKNFIRGST